MIIIKKKLVYLLAAITIFIVILLGVLSYWEFIRIDAGDALNLKFYSEHFLFMSILALLVLIAVFTLILLRSRSIFNELDKLIELSKQGSASPDDYLKRLDVLGEKILEINARLLNLNTMKSLKISALSHTTNFLLAKIQLPLLISDITGQITKVSQQLLTDFQIDPKNIVGRYIDEIMDGINFTLLTTDLKKVKNLPLKTTLQLGVPDKATDCYPIFYPVFNSQNELANVICALENEETYRRRKEKQSAVASPANGAVGQTDGTKDKTPKRPPSFGQLLGEIFHPPKK